jgi:hypothetical protein
VLASGPVKKISASQGGLVRWTVLAPGNHSITDISGMDLFNSGVRSTLSYYQFRFTSAGTYTYIDVGNALLATVAVPLTVVPASGSTSTPFTATWAVTAPPAGYVVDVQIKRPGSAAFVDWKPSTTTLSAPFTADAGAGTYRFQARIRRLDNQAASGYSAAASITVT